MKIRFTLLSVLALIIVLYSCKKDEENPLPDPSIVSFSPSEGSVGTAVTITGENFGNNLTAITVKFNGQTATVTSATTTQIGVTVPAGATTGKITVSVGDKTTASSNDFTVVEGVPITIVSFDPVAGIPGSTVVIQGTNFSTTASENVVKFNGVNATVTSATATQLIVEVPESASTGKITVTTAGQTATSESNFIVNDPLTAPTITSFTPTSGTTGTSVTITGTNFSATPANNTVAFNGAVAAITSASTQQLVVTVPSNATTGKITVTVDDQLAISANNFFFNTAPVTPPAISGFTPASGDVGSAVTITGSNFSTTAANNTVKFNGVTATVTSASATQLVVSVPDGASTGKISVTVNEQTATTTTDFFVGTPAITPPSISSFSPTSGNVGTAVVITGDNFSLVAAENTVKFNNTTATVTAATKTQLNVTVPSGATTGKITVTVSEQTATSGSDFTVTLPAPTISGFTPSSGSVGSIVTINGSNFSTVIASNDVRFNGTSASVTSATSTQLVVTVPSGASTGKITVTVGGQTATSATDFTVSVAPLIPTVSSFTPTSGVSGTGITINGTNFSTTPGNNTVKFNNVTATVTSASATQLIATVPNGATTGKITVTVGGQTGTSASDFTVIPVPTISGFSPSSGPVGTPVTITGTNFSATPANNTVKFNNTTATVTAASATSLTVTVPSGATTGTITVTVGGQTATSATNFTVTVLTPTITNFSPTSGAVGTPVTITGTNFSTTPANNIVKFNGVTTTVSSATSTSLVVTVPSGASTGKISVEVNAETALSGSNFSVTPTVSSFSPTSGTGGTTVTISGNSFSATPGQNTVTFNGVTATVTAQTTTSLTVTVPNGATTGKIAVTVGGFTGTSTGDFTTVPSVTSFSPSSGGVGSAVTITGTNFSATPANNTVKFNNTTATVSAASATSLTVTVPSGATTGKITVTVGGQTGTSASDFTVTAGAPTITSFLPEGGIPGISVIITGTNFSATPANNTVKFANNQTATVTAASATQLTVTVPSGTVTGTISVTVSGQTATSSSNFTAVSNTIPTSGLVAFYPFSGNANDASGNNLHGTVSGATLTTDRNGKSSRAYSFDGTNDYISLGNPTELNISGSITIACWVKVTAFELDGGQPKDYNILSKYVSEVNVCKGYSFKTSFSPVPAPGFGLFALAAYTVTGNIYYEGDYAAGTWVFLAATLTGNTVTYYQNGIEYMSYTDARALENCGASNVIIGASSALDSKFFKGAIDDLMIYNRVLSGTEIEALYDQTITNY